MSDVQHEAERIIKNATERFMENIRSVKLKNELYPGKVNGRCNSKQRMVVSISMSNDDLPTKSTFGTNKFTPENHSSCKTKVVFTTNFAQYWCKCQSFVGFWMVTRLLELLWIQC